MMKKMTFRFLILVFLLPSAMSSCKEETKPKAIVRVMETVDGVLTPVYQAFVKVGPNTKEAVLSDVKEQAYTNKDGYIEFEFERELVLNAEAIKPRRDQSGGILFSQDGLTPQAEKDGHAVLLLKFDYVENKIIELK